MPTYDRRFLFGSLTTAAPPALLLCVLLWRPNLLEDGSTSWLKPMFQPEQYRAEKLDRAKPVLFSAWKPAGRSSGIWP